MKKTLTKNDDKMLATARIAARGFVLSMEEKTRMRKNIVTHMQAHPASGYHPIRWIDFSLVSRSRSLIAGAVLSVVLIGSVSYAAEGALPGETLYSMKVNVNEKIQRLVALTPKAQATWEADAAERRLSEIEKLAQKGKLNPEIKAKIKVTFENHAEEAKKKIAELKSTQDAKAAVEISSNFESTLRAHEKILTQLESGNGASTSILASVKIKTATIAQERADAEDTIATKTPEELKIAAAQNQQNAEYQLAKIRTFYTASSKNLSATSSAKIISQLKGAETHIQKGREQLGKSSYRNAMKLFQQAIGTAHETNVLLQASGQFSLDLSADLDDDEDSAVAPATPTTTITTNTSSTQKGTSTPATTTPSRENTKGSPSKRKSGIHIGL